MCFLPLLTQPLSLFPRFVLQSSVSFLLFFCPRLGHGGNEEAKFRYQQLLVNQWQGSCKIALCTVNYKKCFFGYVFAGFVWFFLIPALQVFTSWLILSVRVFPLILTLKVRAWFGLPTIFPYKFQYWTFQPPNFWNWFLTVDFAMKLFLFAQKPDNWNVTQSGFLDKQVV